MKIISHRGCLYGPDLEIENTVSAAERALGAGFDVEIDVWRSKDGLFYLGHDEPTNEVSLAFLTKTNLWLHCKNVSALIYLKKYSNCFMNDEDVATLTSSGNVWTVLEDSPAHEDVVLVINSNAVGDIGKLLGFGGICTDYPIEIRERADVWGAP